MDLSNSGHVELYDSDLLKMEKGPLRWMKSKQGSSMDLEAFRRGAEEQFGEVGFEVNVKCYDTNQDGMFAFEVDILRRVNRRFTFDYDQMIHEVTSNILEIPGQEKGFIKAPQGAEARRLAQQKPHKH